MNPGEFKQRLRFMLPSGDKDADGFPVNEPTQYAKARGKLKTLKGDTFYAAAQNNMEHNRDFTIRYQSKLSDGIRPEGLKVVWREMEHDVVSIENDDGLNVTMSVVLKAVSG
ncbi:phage head closure protein [Sutcliffiella horikoshii]|uniref:phage head closure protein n=1 Tax=Sutcliffiella horikoshii TaxID=79883 RepID=UPI003CEC1B0F